MLDAILSLLPYDGLAFLALAAAWILTKELRKWLLSQKVMDVPNGRSMHKTPVPRGGGLAVVAVIVVGLVLASFFVTFPVFSLFPALLLLIAVSWLDDRKGLPPALRLAAHLLAAFLGSFAFGETTTLFGDVLPFWLDRLVLILLWAWLINLTNFMDGIDGITCVQTAATTLGAGFILWYINFLFLKSQSLNPDLILASLTAGACLGFLLHNWHPARIFLGDVGSVPLGFLTGYLLFKLALMGYPVAALILPLYYLADSGLTLGQRLLRGEKVWQPHREHFYQRAAAGKGSPVPIVVWILDVDLILIVLAGFSLFYPLLALLLAVLTVALLLVKLHKSAKKGRP